MKPENKMLLNCFVWLFKKLLIFVFDALIFWAAVAWIFYGVWAVMTNNIDIKDFYFDYKNELKNLYFFCLFLVYVIKIGGLMRNNNGTEHY